MRINFSKNELGGRDRVVWTEGVHEVNIKKSEIAKSKAGADYFVVHVENFSKQPLAVWCCLDDDKKYLLRKLLQACGMPLKQGMNDFDEKLLIGRKVKAKVETRTKTAPDRSGEPKETKFSTVTEFHPLDWEEGV
jgi:hypothetical protein